MPSFPKSGSCESPTYLSFIRGLSCYGCDSPPPSSAHHFPPRGRGVTDDTSTMPVCTPCHQRAHGITVAGRPNHEGRTTWTPIAEDMQEAAVDSYFRTFMSEAPQIQVDQVIRDLARRRADRVYTSWTE